MKHKILNLIKKIIYVLRIVQFRIVWPAIFFIFKQKPVKKDRILFADAFSTDLTDNMVPVYQALCASKDRGLRNFELKKCFAPAPTGNAIIDRLRLEFQYILFFKEYAQSSVLVLTDSYLPAYAVKPRKGTSVVQLWHGCGAFKKWGYATLSKTFGASAETAKLFPMHNCYSLVPVSSSAVVPAYAEAFQCSPDAIKPFGVPRTDVFFDHQFVSTAKSRLYASCTEVRTLCGNADDFANKTVVLFAPTFRGENITAAHSDCKLDLLQLKNALGDNFIILYKLHPFIKEKFEIPPACKTFVANVSSVPTDLCLCAADVLITDYSSIIFEYALLNRPMIFYAYDLDEYTAERDFFYKYEDFVPGKIVRTQNELENVLCNMNAHFNETAVKNFAEKYMCACDGSSTKRIVESIIE